MVNKIFCFLCSALFFLSLVATGQANCILRKDQDSIKVYNCHTDSSKFKSISAEFNLHTSLQQLQDFMLDFPHYTTWQYNTTESRVLTKINDSEFIYYTKIEAPWPVTDRDMVVHLTIKRTPNQLVIRANSITGMIPLQANYIRVPSSHSQWIISKRSSKNLQVMYQMQIDPGGYIPVWLVNWVCAQGPYQSFKKLKEQLEVRRRN